MTPQELKAKPDADEPLLLLGVRQPEELEISRFPSSHENVLLDDLMESVNQLSLTSEVIVFCRNDQQSRLAARMLRGIDFERVKVLKGGIKRVGSGD